MIHQIGYKVLVQLYGQTYVDSSDRLFEEVLSIYLDNLLTNTIMDVLKILSVGANNQTNSSSSTTSDSSTIDNGNSVSDGGAVVNVASGDTADFKTTLNATLQPLLGVQTAVGKNRINNAVRKMGNLHKAKVFRKLTSGKVGSYQKSLFDPQAQASRAPSQSLIKTALLNYKQTYQLPSSNVGGVGMAVFPGNIMNVAQNFLFAGDATYNPAAGVMNTIYAGMLNGYANVSSSWKLNRFIVQVINTQSDLNSQGLYVGGMSYQYITGTVMTDRTVPQSLILELPQNAQASMSTIKVTRYNWNPTI